jgi:hypothetical protein
MMENYRDDTGAQAKRILQAVWGPHYRFVGEEFVDRIQSALERGESVDNIVASGRGGDSFEWAESVKILFEGLQVVATVLSIYSSTLNIRSKKELKEKAQAAGIEDKTTNPAVKSKIDAVIEEAAK